MLSPNSNLTTHQLSLTKTPKTPKTYTHTDTGLPPLKHNL